MKCSIIEVTDRINLELVNHRVSLSQEDTAVVESVWQEAVNEGKFNGTILGYLGHTVSSEGLITITSYVEEYKYFLAQVRHPELGFLVQPIGVSAATVDASGTYLIGRRGKHVTQYPNNLEFVPSGGISPNNTGGKDLHLREIIKEFEEETRFASREINSVDTFGLVYNPEHGVYDIEFRILLGRDLRKERNLRKEHQSEEKVKREDLGNFISNNIVIPSMHTIYQLLKEHGKI